MVFALCIRRSASRLASRLCGRVARSQAISSVAVVNRSSLLRPFVSRSFLYSTTSTDERLKSDQTLIQVIDSEIKDADLGEEETPGSDDFPFKIEDNPGHRTVTLTREYNGEQIRVEVSMPGSMDEHEDDVDDNEDGRNEKANETSIPLVVTVTKKSGLSLEFSCTAFPDEIVIDGLSVNHPEKSSSSEEEQLAYDGPDFQELDENMRKSFHKFLEARGIKPSVTDLMYEYMMKKDSREYLLWLKNLKNFIQE
ncbi:Mitochondrial glycoprotein family protein [Raphanus sativus]|uniref:Uncharacterized protein At2g39795, mitochondrial n=1 Tax=Raphanus sativus TaxID=3726 RepID=A0A6J0NIZ8_RAPSA|nr:uncharacterized protein At2g39795, mitochondrial [Raphanus sativus]KAJ4904722.1 Mitochondrial glycoprotein family protein [Raphanus sativus]